METHKLTVIDDEASILEVVGQHLSEKGFDVVTYTDPKKAIAELSEQKPNLVITDLKMDQVSGIDVIRAVKKYDPEINVIIMTAYASIDSAVSAIRSGAIDYVIKPFKFEDLDIAIQRGLHQTRFISAEKQGGARFSDKYKVKNLVGTSPLMQRVYELIEKSAKTASTVLITGESGTGKELAARAIHYNSKRKSANFVGINCAALPEPLLESELFGHEKGSFTGAVATKEGLFELAHKGSFFMDEVVEITLPIQVKLLRVLQEKTIKRVGGLRDIPVDVRIIAATSRDLTTAVKEEKFRHELYYRLNVIPIHLPPLRQRKEDIPKLVEHFITLFSKQMQIDKKITIDLNAVRKLQEHDWPGNVRELENVIERILALSEGGKINLDQVNECITPSLGIGKISNLTTTGDGQTLKDTVDDYEKQIIEEALKANHGSRAKAAKQLGLTRQNFQYKLKKYGWA